jgi:hypothetical protein
VLRRSSPSEAIVGHREESWQCLKQDVDWVWAGLLLRREEFSR